MKMFFGLTLALSSFAAPPPAGVMTAGFFPGGIFDANPDRSTSYYDLVFLSQVGQPLVEQNEVAEIIPGVASSWEISADRKRYRFNIRQDLTFHDGSKLTIEDVVYSLNRAIYSPRNASYFYLNVIEGYEAGRKSGQCPGIRIVSPSILEMRITRPYTPILRALTSGSMVIGKSPQGTNPAPGHFIGTGPYRVVAKGTDKYLEAFPRYVGPYPPTIGRVNLVADTDTLLGRRRAGAAMLPDYLIIYMEDILGPLDPQEYQVVRKPGMMAAGFYLNQRSRRFRTKEARLKLAATLHRVLDKVPHGMAGTRLEDLFPAGMLGHKARRGTFQRLIRGTGAGESLGFPEISVGVFSQISGGNEAFAKAFERETGSRVAFVQLSVSDTLRELAATDADVIYVGWKSVFLDPEANLTPFQFVNAFDLSPRREEFKRLRHDATTAVLDTDRAVAYGKIADLIFSEALFLPDFQRDELQAIRKTLKHSKYVYRYSPMFSELELVGGR